jgi:hypothetical protein
MFYFKKAHRKGVGEGRGEMTQTLYAHINKIKNKKHITAIVKLTYLSG